MEGPHCQGNQNGLTKFNDTSLNKWLHVKTFHQFPHCGELSKCLSELAENVGKMWPDMWKKINFLIEHIIKIHPFPFHM